MSGWICMHRSFTQWEWYTDPNTSRLFIHCLLTANHKKKSWRGITIERGQFLTSLDSLSENLCLTKQQVRTALNKLKSTHEITLKTSTKNTMVTVSQYEKYQSPTHEATREITHEQHTDNTQITPTNNVTKKQCNKEEKGTSVAVAPSKPKKVFIKPELNELASYFQEKGSLVCNDDSNDFFDFYTSNGWKVGKNSMKDWKATARRWLKTKTERATSRPNGQYLTANEKAAARAAQTGKLDSPEDLEW